MFKKTKKIKAQELVLYNNILALSRNKLLYTIFNLTDTFQNRIHLIFIHVSFLFIKIKHSRYKDVYKIFKTLPPLLKGYLRIGAKVSNGAFIDKQFNTIDICIVLKSNLLKQRYLNLHKKGAKDSKIIFLKKFLKRKK